MPDKFNANRRAKIPKQTYRVTNWTENNEGLRRRCDLTVWISDEALGLWSAARRTTRGGKSRYSGLSIELYFDFGHSFQATASPDPRYTRGITGILGLEIAGPDLSILSRQGNGLILQTSLRADKQAVIHLVVDSTGLKIFGEGEWPEQERKAKRKWRSWR